MSSKEFLAAAEVVPAREKRGHQRHPEQHFGEPEETRRKAEALLKAAAAASVLG